MIRRACNHASRIVCIDHGTWTRDSVVPIKASLDWVGPVAFGMLELYL
jgi:hypothetical protein